MSTLENLHDLLMPSSRVERVSQIIKHVDGVRDQYAVSISIEPADQIRVPSPT